VVAAAVVATAMVAADVAVIVMMVVMAALHIGIKFQLAGDQGFEYDGLICHVTAALPQGSGIDGIGAYGDYYYLEALMRFAHPDWEKYW